MKARCSRLHAFNSAGRYERAFTLIEILVVLLIMGLFVGLVSTIIRPDDRALLRVEADRLAQLLDLAAMEARYSGKRVAWTSDGEGYRFWRLGAESEWAEVRDVDALRPRTLPKGIRIAALKVENSPPRQTMRLEYTTFGPPLAYVIDMTFGESRYSLESSAIGVIRVVPDDRTSSAEPATR
jgi:general secretion pathway protein H